MYTVFVEDLEFYGYHGASAEERSVGHRFVVGVRVVVDAGLPGSDRIEDTVDYARLAGVVIGVGTGEGFKTVEALAGKMCDAILLTFPKVRDVSLDVCKAAPPFPYVAKSAGIHVAATRAGRHQSEC